MSQQTSATTWKAHDFYYSIKINARDKRRHKKYFTSLWINIRHTVKDLNREVTLISHDQLEMGLNDLEESCLLSLNENHLWNGSGTDSH